MCVVCSVCDRLSVVFYHPLFLDILQCPPMTLAPVPSVLYVLLTGLVAVGIMNAGTLKKGKNLSVCVGG